MAGSLLLVPSPLVGPLTWEPTAALLRDEGWRVIVPSLTADGPPYHRKFAEAAARAWEGGGPVVVAGHSGAGPLLPEIAALLGADARGAVFVDASLPHPGAAWLDIAPAARRSHLTGLVRDGRVPPWNQWFPPEAIEELVPEPELRERFIAELPTLPLAYFEEPAPDVPDLPARRCAYVRLSEAYDQAAEEAGRRGWWVRREDADHLAPLTRPGEVAGAVAWAAARVSGG